MALQINDYYVIKNHDLGKWMNGEHVNGRLARACSEDSAVVAVAISFGKKPEELSDYAKKHCAVKVRLEHDDTGTVKTIIPDP
jgi:hypothetical protein